MRAQPSDDSLAILLLCSHLAIGKGLSLKPLNDADWSVVTDKLVSTHLKPGDLLGKGADELRGILGLDAAAAERMARLLARGGQLALELERLSSLGVWAMTRADPGYPGRLRRRLRQRMPAMLFGIGRPELLSKPGIAIVGSRSLDDEGLRYATEAGRRVAEAGAVVFSGGSRGADAAAMQGALAESGPVVGVLSEGVVRSLRDGTAREHVLDGDMTLASPFHPDMTFRAANAMARNKIVYCLADAALVISASDKSGGTWAGATEALRGKWLPVFVRNGVQSPPGNQGLIREGAQPAPFDPTTERSGFSGWVRNLVNRANALAAPAPINPPEDPIFDTVFPLLAGLLVEPRTADDVARRMQLEHAQAEAWLQKAVRLNLLVREASFYRLSDPPGPAGHQERLPFE